MFCNYKLILFYITSKKKKKMNAHIITIGDEILIGQIIDSNSAYIGQKFTEIGIKVEKISSISDNRNAIINTFSETEAKINIITGGLGPTKDDITKQCISEFFNSELVENKEVLQNIIHLIENIFKRKMNDLNVQQSYIPKIATPLMNKVGTAPGIWIEKGDKIFIFLPGVPFEMKKLMTDEVLPKLKSIFKLPYIVQKHLLLLNIPESELAILLSDWENKLPSNISLAYLPQGARIKLRLTAKGNNREELEKILHENIESLKPIISKNLYSISGEKIEELIGKKLLKNQLTLSTAESCTGGNIAKIITSVSGSSQYFIGSIVSYSTRIKEEFLHVSAKNIATYSVVSEEVAKEMATGIQKNFKTDLALSVTGVAGPNKGEDQKEIGNAWIALAVKDKIYSKHIFIPNLQRNDFIENISLKALDFLLLHID